MSINLTYFFWSLVSVFCRGVNLCYSEDANKYMLSNSTYNFSSSWAQLYVCTQTATTPCINIYVQNLWHSFSPLLDILKHNQKKKPHVSPEILLSQLRFWNTIHRSSWWRTKCCKIQLEVYEDRWRGTPLSVIPLSSFLLHKRTHVDSHSHMDTRSSRWPTYMKSTHNYAGVCSQLRGNLSAALVWSQWAALHCWVCSLCRLEGGRPPLSRHYPLPSNIHQLLGDWGRQVNLIGSQCTGMVGVVVCTRMYVSPH